MYKYLLMYSKTALVIYQCKLIHTNTCSKILSLVLKFLHNFFVKLISRDFHQRNMLFVASAEAQFLVWWIWYLLSFLLWIHFTEKDLLCTAALPDDSIVMTSKKAIFFEKITSNSVEFWKMIQNDTFPYKLTLFDYFSFHCSHDPHIQIQLFFYSIWFLNVKFYLVETFEKRWKIDKKRQRS